MTICFLIFTVLALRDHSAVSSLLLLVFLIVKYLVGWAWKQMFLR